MLFLWIVCYPVIYFRRRHFGRPNLGPLAFLVAVFFVALWFNYNFERFGIPVNDFSQLVLVDGRELTNVDGCESTKQQNLLILRGPGGDRARVITAKEHKPPFALRVNAKTDSTNLRLYYNRVGVLIFNWECNENELRIHDPATGEQEGVADQGKIEPGKYHDIVWEVYPNGMRVLVDGKERARRRGNYERLEGSLGIGPAWGSVVTVKSFQVEELKGKVPL
jgi:hypothetical protein